MRKFVRRVSALAMFLAATAAPALGQGNAFTYQGKLELSGAAVNGPADFQFRLFDSSSGGNQIGSTQSFPGMNLVNGVFTASLDFGAGAFNGDPRFLEIATRSPSGAGNFIILTPRQRITAAPYALKVAGIDGNSLNSANGNVTDALFVDNEGDVGIGTLSPQGRFDIRSGANSYFRIDGANGDLHMNGGNDGVAGIFNDTAGANARLDFITNNTAQMVVTGDGRVGIGTTTPAALRRLTIQTGEIFTGRFESTHPIASVVELSNTTGGVWEWGAAGNQPPSGVLPGAMYFYKQGEQDLALAIMPNQWIGMGVNNPGFRLDLPNIGNNDGRARANRWDTYSSVRWKDNVRTIENALDKVMHLRGVTFDWKPEHGGSHDVGFVAEEAGKILPELVSWEKDGQWAQGLAYDHITAVTVEAIKEQQHQIESLKQANTDLRERLDELTRLVEAARADAAK